MEPQRRQSLRVWNWPLEHALALLAVLFLGMVVRFSLVPVSAGDQWQFLTPWYEAMKENGGLAAIGMKLGDYLPPYFYILGFLTYLPMEPIPAIKLVSCLVDVLLAYYAMRLVSLGGGGSLRMVFSFAAVFLLPTVILNSAAWAQCDTIFTSALLACLYHAARAIRGEGKHEDYKTVLCFSVAFVFKLQAIFLGPALLLLFLQKKLRWRTVLLFPAVYLAAVLPAAIAGRSLWDLITAYGRQSQMYNHLNMNLPNVWAGFLETVSEPVGRAGVFFAGAVVLLGLLFLWRRPCLETAEGLVSVAALSLMIVPFFLPYMHERYYYPADVTTVILACFFPKKAWIPLLLQICSGQVVAHFIFGIPNMELKFLALLAGAALLGLILHVEKSSRPKGEAVHA